jgi:hypothetical protein
MKKLPSPKCLIRLYRPRTALDKWEPYKHQIAESRQSDFSSNQKKAIIPVASPPKNKGSEAQANNELQEITQAKLIEMEDERVEELALF